MIKKFKTINNVAVFKNYEWDQSCRDKGNNIVEFKKLNIIYGRNYSGKTVLSRIVRSLEKKELPDKYLNSDFELETDEGIINKNNITTNKLDIRVYNRDFVDDNLDFLKNDNGQILPFAVVGEVSVDLKRKIDEKEEDLGSEEKQTGLKYQCYLQRESLKEKKSDIKNKDRRLETQLTNQAKIIKHNRIYDRVIYNIRNIKDDINDINNSSFKELTEDEIEKNRQLEKEESKANITNEITYLFSKLETFCNESNDLLEKEIEPTKPIDELLNNAELQNWVAEGIRHHRNKRTKCAFCDNSIDESTLWQKLDDHFNRDSNELKNAIENKIIEIQASKIEIQSLNLPQKEKFYSQYQSQFESFTKQIEIAIEQYNKFLKEIKNKLETRKNEIFNHLPKIQLTDNTQTINAQIKNIKELIQSHNQTTDNFVSRQKGARKKLRLNEVFTFLNTIQYTKEKKEIDELRKIETKLQDYSNKTNEKVEKLQKEIDALRTKQKEEKIATEKINYYLNHAFGVDSIKFEPVEKEDNDGYFFEIKRGDKPAYNLSEGEKSLVAFCYFIAKLKDSQSKEKKLIIWIDDPISSLDSSHIFFMFSLIESVITHPIKKDGSSNEYKYKQLFISTHNLDFLKYLKRISKPKKKENNTDRNDVEYFLLQRQTTGSQLLFMPNYLKKYTTEFIYLFEQIYKCSQITNNEESHNIYYNFANNLRKFLEAYLFYKYPNNQDIKIKRNKFFTDNISEKLSKRFENEFSHLEEIFDRSMRPIEIPEIPKLADCVLKTIKEKDSEQYDAFLESIGENPTKELKNQNNERSNH